MNLDISTLPFSPTLITKLLDNGFKFGNDLMDVSISELAKECSISHQDAMEIINFVTKSKFSLVTTHVSALELLTQQKPSIFTFCEEMDQILGGGIQLGSLTELCGLPGIGKTQIASQLAINVQLVKELDGIQGKCIYLDTEGSFVPERIEQMATGFLDHFSKTKIGREKMKWTTEDILSNIYYYRLHSYVEQVSIINVLPSFLKEHENVKLIVLDSVAFHFRSGFENDMANRTRILQGIGKNLSIIASQFNIAVLVLNQVTTKFENNKSTVIPALGESWSHVCQTRLFLTKEKERTCTVFKSSTQKESTAVFDITKEGVRSVKKRLLL
jgi:RAD51-like protein 2